MGRNTYEIEILTLTAIFLVNIFLLNSRKNKRQEPFPVNLSPQVLGLCGKDLKGTHARVWKTREAFLRCYIWGWFNLFEFYFLSFALSNLILLKPSLKNMERLLIENLVINGSF